MTELLTHLMTYNHFSAAELLIEIVLNLYISLGGIDNLTVMTLPSHEYGISLHLFSSPLIFFIRILYFLQINLVHTLLDLCLVIFLQY